jgi:uncharacterized protein (DUF488 family)
MRVYTLGYEGLELHQYINVLLQHDIGLVLDVRRHVSRQWGFPKEVLHNYLSKAGVTYQHIPKAASSSNICTNGFSEYLLDNRSVLWSILAALQRTHESGKASCISCYKSSYSQCHRSELSDWLSILSPMITIEHLATLPSLVYIVSPTSKSLTGDYSPEFRL